ncbi:MAG: hypothetical protein KKB31_05120 [Nanoarchaeota archaeon]|nr:hypothetical protein [Nanoarchaeota archaeon]
MKKTIIIYILLTVILGGFIYADCETIELQEINFNNKDIGKFKSVIIQDFNNISTDLTLKFDNILINNYISVLKDSDTDNFKYNLLLTSLPQENINSILNIIYEDCTILNVPININIENNKLSGLFNKDLVNTNKINRVLLTGNIFDIEYKVILLYVLLFISLIILVGFMYIENLNIILRLIFGLISCIIINGGILLFIK